MKFLVKVFWIFFIFLGLGFIFFDEVSAKDYDIYVDADASGDQDGSEDDPYKTIAKAIEEAGAGDEIYIEKGEYEENLTINKKVSFFGADLKEVIVEGEIKIEKDVEIQGLTISGNVVIKSGPDVIFDNLIIKEAHKIAVEAYEGSGEIVIKNSTIKRSGTKGFYIQRGRDIVITGCNVYSNEEEGIDLRSNVDGTISGNNVYENGESGLEFLVAESKLIIKNNVFKNNGSSGIAAQYYKDLKKRGEITILSNTSTGNDKYGLDCNNPQGGDPSSSYWTGSITVDKNNFKTNDKGEISKVCSLNQPTQEAQEKKQNEEREKELEENKKENELQAQIIEQNRQKTIQENEYLLDNLVKSKKELKDEVVIEKEKIENRGGLVTFLIGPNYKAIENIKKVAPGFGEHLTKFDDLGRKLIEAENQKIAEEEQVDIRTFVKEVNDLIVDRNNKFSLFGWLFKIMS